MRVTARKGSFARGRPDIPRIFPCAPSNSPSPIYAKMEAKGESGEFRQSTQGRAVKCKTYSTKR